jgi:CheY-like chemotaxis protein
VLAGGMAHDFNNLLATIVGNANLASMMVEPDSKVSAFMTAIEKAAMRAAKLTRQMLAYSGQGKYHQAVLDLNLVLKESMHFIPVPIASQVHVHVILSDRLPFVQGDPSQISEVMVNLLTNALEAMETGREGRLIVRTSAESLDQAGLESCDWALAIQEPGHFATLEVTDEGAGMGSEIMSQLFEPFFTTKFTGRGLGLPEVMGVLRSHGGGILVRSEPGRGSTFKLFFPAMRAPRTKPPVDFLPVWRGQGRILVVDDEEEERNRVRRMAEQLGFSVLEAAGGPEAVELFRLRHGDLALVLLDLSLPRMDGLAALQEIRKINSTIPVVLGTPYQAREPAPPEAQAGCLKKPYRQAEFQGLLQRTLA